MASGPRRGTTRWPGALRRHLPALLTFLVLSAAATWPLVMAPGSTVKDEGDPLLNAWIMAWEVHALTTGDLAGFHDTNAFYPNRRTLTYSELLLPQSLAAAPVLLATGNPVLAYNLVYLVSLALTGFATYLLGAHLSGSRRAGLVAGAVFAFCPFMFDHLSHLQILSAWGIPLTFLFLHRWLERGRPRDLAGAAASFVLQALANTHYFLYLLLFAGCFVAIHLLEGRVADRRWGRHVAIAGTASVAVLVPFYLPYLQLRTTFDFFRSIVFYAEPWSFLATPGINRLYGGVTASLQGAEANLFPGFTPLALALVAVVAAVRRRSAHPGEGGARPGEGGTRPGEGGARPGETAGEGRARRGAPGTGPPRESGGHAPGGVDLGRPPRVAVGTGLAVEVLLVVYAVLLVVVTVTEGFRLELPFLEISVTRPQFPALACLFLPVVRRLMRRRWPGLPTLFPRVADPVRIYLVVVAWGALLTFGPDGPYVLLHRWVPGFNALRVASRFHVMVMLGLAVLAGLGFRRLEGRLSTRGAAAALAGVFVLLGAEYVSVPVPMAGVPVGDEIPEVYRWMARQPQSMAILELPVRPRMETFRMYASTFHWKELANGYSGFFPPLYEELEERRESVLAPRSLDQLRALGITHVVLHRSRYRDDEWRRVEAWVARAGDGLPRVAELGDARVHALSPDPAAGAAAAGTTAPGGPAAGPGSMGPGLDPGPLLSREGWAVAAEPFRARAPAAIDGDPRTRWTTGRPQRPGDRFELDLGRDRTISGLILRFGGSPVDYPRGYRLEAAADGEPYRVVAEAQGERPPLSYFLHARTIRLPIEFEPVRARRLRLIQTGQDRVRYWSIHEVDVVGGDDPP